MYSRLKNIGPPKMRNNYGVIKLSISLLLLINRSLKRYSIIDQHLARHFKNNGASLCSQIITTFSHLMLSANQERGL